jgi:hypothetical protein
MMMAINVCFYINKFKGAEHEYDNENSKLAMVSNKFANVCTGAFLASVQQ